MKKLSVVTATLLAAVVALAFAPVAMAGETSSEKGKIDHGKMMVAKGEIVSISKSSVEVKTHDGKILALMVNDKTRFGTDKSPMKADQFAKGDHVAIRYCGEDKMMTALGISKPGDKESHVAEAKTPGRK